MKRTSGISLMLLIFLSLCLIVFSLLSLSGATADETLSKKAADRTTEYYHASSSANALIADIDHQLAHYLKRRKLHRIQKRLILANAKLFHRIFRKLFGKRIPSAFLCPSQRISIFRQNFLSPIQSRMMIPFIRLFHGKQ